MLIGNTILCDAYLRYSMAKISIKSENKDIMDEKRCKVGDSSYCQYRDGHHNTMSSDKWKSNNNDGFDAVDIENNAYRDLFLTPGQMPLLLTFCKSSLLSLRNDILYGFLLGRMCDVRQVELLAIILVFRCILIVF